MSVYSIVPYTCIDCHQHCQVDYNIERIIGVVNMIHITEHGGLLHFSGFINALTYGSVVGTKQCLHYSRWPHFRDVREAGFYFKQFPILYKPQIFVMRDINMACCNAEEDGQNNLACDSACILNCKISETWALPGQHVWPSSTTLYSTLDLSTV